MGGEGGREEMGWGRRGGEGVKEEGRKKEISFSMHLCVFAGVS